MQQPKNITKNFTFRNIPYGNNRRVMWKRAVQDHQPHFPKAVGYNDIDQAVFDWVDKELELTYQGKELPTYKLFSNQRLAEVAQNSENMDEKGNLRLNFKTISRESNPQHGDLTGNNYNIPGNREYTLFKTLIAEEKGDEVVQIYTMKQPFAVNLIYTVNIFTNSINIINEMNTMMQDEFKSLQRYIFPNNHPMPMELNSVGDESDYTIDDRKYYAQSYQIKVMAYIIKEDDLKVKKVRSRLRNQFVVGENSKNKVQKEKFDIEALSDGENQILFERVFNGKCVDEEEIQMNIIKNTNIEEEIYSQSEITIEEAEGLQQCWEGTDFAINVMRKITYTSTLKSVKSTLKWKIEQDLGLETVILNNVRNLEVKVNGIDVNLEDSDLNFYKDDEIELKISLKNPTKEGNISIICYDPESIEEQSKEILL